MAANSNPSSVSSNPTASSTSTKRKTPARKAAASSAPAKSTKKSAAASSAGPKEILFKDEPRAHLDPVPPYIWIDHPQQSERLYAPHYALRVGVGGAEEVQVSIDKGEWQSCRYTVGYWWYDLHNLSQGKHTAVARMRTAGGQWYRTPPRAFQY